jgi:hypothetical protein
MGRVYSTCEGDEECIWGFYKKTRREDNIKMDFREKGWRCMDWINLAKDDDQWRALVDTVMHLRVL